MFYLSQSSEHNRLVGYFISHRFSQRNRGLSANRGNTQTSASRRQISQNVIADVSWKVLWYLYAGGVLWDRNCAQKGSVKSVSSVREKPPQWVSQLFFFSQRNTEEQNTQHSTETLSQPISQNLTANISWNVLWYLYAGGLLWVRNSAQKDSVKSVCSVREKPPQWVSQLFFFSQRNTEEQNTQHSTETLSQPISQNLTATFSWNALWYLYAGGLLWARNCAQKGSVKSVSSVRKKTPQRVS